MPANLNNTDKQDIKNFENYPNLVSGGKVLFATDDFFAVCENLILDSEPKFDPKTYTKFGKEMDGWETRRKRIAGHDWCIIELGHAGVIRGFHVDTAHFTGNVNNFKQNVPSISIQAFNGAVSLKNKRTPVLGSQASQADIDSVKAINSHAWTTILNISDLKAGVPETRHHYFKIQDDKRYTHIRLNAFPDGGIARLRIYGNVDPEWHKIESPCDLALISHGGKTVSWSNAHYGSPMRLLERGRSTGMHDGWETARNPRRPKVYQTDNKGLLNFVGHEWCIVKLGKPCSIHKVIIDTNHFKGNFPESFTLEYTTDETFDGAKWKPLIPRSKLSPHVEEVFENLDSTSDARFVRLTMMPDGGISRLRVIGDFKKRKQ